MVRLNLTTKIPYFFGNIYEYDIKSAYFSIIQARPEFIDNDISIIKKLEKLKSNKKELVIFIGKMIRRNPDLSKNLHNYLRETIYMFIKENNISNDDIISIKKDALFVKKRVNSLDINGLDFKVKHNYKIFFKDTEKKEYYILNEDTFNIKGINDIEVNSSKKFFKLIVQLIMLLLNSNKEAILNSLNTFQTNFLYGTPQVDYLTINNQIKLKNGYLVDRKFIDEFEIEEIDRDFIYFKYIHPVISQIIKITL